MLNLLFLKSGTSTASMHQVLLHKASSHCKQDHHVVASFLSGQQDISEAVYHTEWAKIIKKCNLDKPHCLPQRLKSMFFLKIHF